MQARGKAQNRTLLPKWVKVHCRSKIFKIPSLTRNADVIRTTLTITKLKKFIDFYGNYSRGDRQITKIAIIDNGIDTTLSSLSRRIVDGHSYVEDFEGRESPWWLASHPHGTQMASFIHQLDPFCGFYIAKVCDDTTGVDPDLVAQVCTKIH